MSKVIDSTNLGHLWDLIKQYADGAVAAIASKLVPSGGTAGQVLAKASATDHDLTWVTPSSGPGSDTTYTLSGDGETVTLTGSDQSTSSATITAAAIGAQAALSVTTGTISKGSAASSYTAHARKYGHVVTVDANNVKLASALSSASTSGTVMTLPSGYRPAAQMLVPWTGTGAAYGYVTISTGGVVTMRNSSASSQATSAAAAFSATFIVN